MTRLAYLAAVAAVAAAPPAHALEVTSAWVAPAPKDADAPVYFAVEGVAAPDLLLRVRCPAAQFAELRVIDRGEGAPSARVVKSLPIAAGNTTFGPGGPHIMLLTLIQNLQPADTFTCRATFRDAGPKDVVVTVKPK